MPDELDWQSLFDVHLILTKLCLDSSLADPG